MFVNPASLIGAYVVEHCIFDSCVDGIVESRASDDALVLIQFNVFYNNDGDGLEFDEATEPNNKVVRVENNIFFDNGGYGWHVTDSAAARMMLGDRNAYYSNTSGASLNVTDSNSITMSADPFTNADAGDFSLNTTAGGGADVRTQRLEIAN